MRQITAFAIFCNANKACFTQSWYLSRILMTVCIKNSQAQQTICLCIADKFLVFCCKKTQHRWILVTDCSTNIDRHESAEKFFNRNRSSQEKIWPTKSQKDWINTQLKQTTFAEKDRKLVNVYASSKVILNLFNTAAYNSYSLRSLLCRKRVVKRFMSILIQKTMTTVSLRSLVFCRGIPRMSVRRA